ncbi:apolipoprotein C-II-like [Trachemys scripta elegans]|uniref:apolipoprotein C-II-like n=1 Tax=Trachemys scripta elegans TaxID=31138 RepID=UPI0015545E7B|nr:apolipoprotein C-II-like [Trachemys scripta elegans]
MSWLGPWSQSEQQPPATRFRALLESQEGATLSTTASMGRMDLKIAVAFVLLLFLCTEAASYRLQKREAQDSFSQIQEVAKSYWERLNSAVQGWMDSVKSWEIYEKTTSAAGTYTEILKDQVYHWWHGEQ